ncbi:MAG: hypothetical protein IT470_07515 [Pseudomonadales bacterium]|nr:hypothetical protein [Pseudomonadales bacterium]
MKKTLLVLTAAASALWGSTALADASCGNLEQDGNTWNLSCSADDSGSEERNYQCDYVLSVTGADGTTQQVNAQGSVGRSGEGVIIWSAIQTDGGVDITTVSIVSGQCVEQ